VRQSTTNALSDLGSFISRIKNSGAITYAQHDLLIDLMFLDDSLRQSDSERLNQLFESIEKGELSVIGDLTDSASTVH